MVLEFDEAVVPRRSKVVVLDAQRRVHPSELLTSATGTVLGAVLGPGADAGAWTIAYEVLSADGHLLSGSLPFPVRAGMVLPSAAQTAGWAVPALLLAFAVGPCAAIRAMPDVGTRIET